MDGKAESSIETGNSILARLAEHWMYWLLANAFNTVQILVLVADWLTPMQQALDWLVPMQQAPDWLL